MATSINKAFQFTESRETKMKDSQAFWDDTAARYAKNPIKDIDSYQKKLTITQEYFQPDWSVLEFGCGTGSTAITHAPFVKKIIATDISSKMLDIAEQKAKKESIKNITFQQGTLDKLEFEPSSFDAILGLNILHLLEDMDAAISRVYNLLKPDGIFVSSTVLVDNINWRFLIPVMQFLGLAPFVHRFGKQELLSRLTDTGFSIDQEWQPGKESVFVIAKK
ncbi:class I SAM-dependent methyltransferase [Microbulbifer sp. OS29]|uniref:Class I SAM-dependent methyltransferase n=1 Tax=Microbulbifer okhotskensis TaxID=2926617 RepID=A0A9X2EVQ2_9GAMM|nr:class I SAM-dependent methyltransferase [Microbulbifer okhotskensis]MCO1336348.1 class I SAM-dependent methyltransferase [Microbulbifer okhotskensis]